MSVADCNRLRATHGASTKMTDTRDGWLDRQLESASATVARWPKAKQEAMSLNRNYRGIMQNDILSALDDCVELGMSAAETRDVIRVIIDKALAP